MMTNSRAVSSYHWTSAVLSIVVGVGLLCPGSTAYNHDVTTTIEDTSGALHLLPVSGGDYSYSTRIVDFVNPYQSLLPPNSILSSNLMVPPADYSHLCEYPPSLVGNGTGVDVAVSPITLLVSMGGGCDVVTKIKVALELKRELTSDLWSVIFYNDYLDGRLDSDDPPFLPTNFSTSDLEGLETMVYGTLGSASGESILMRIADEMSAFGTSPELAVGSANAGWKLPVSMERRNVEGYETGLENLNTDTETDSRKAMGIFSNLLKYVFIAIITVFACIQIVRSNSDIQIVWRRNENGRIVGYDFVVVDDQNASLVRRVRNNLLSSKQPQDLMTKEAVMALPEIEYRTSMQGLAGSDAGSVDDVDLELNQSTFIDATLGGSITCSIRSEVQLMDVPAGTDDVCMTTAQVITIKCTSCSICLEDFEDGELVRVMPRCHHAFHTECIMPWLTERQGRCPFCKTKVVEDDVSSNSDDEPADNHNEAETSQESPNDSETSQESPNDSETSEESNSDSETAEESNRIEAQSVIEDNVSSNADNEPTYHNIEADTSEEESNIDPDTSEESNRDAQTSEESHRDSEILSDDSNRDTHEFTAKT